MAAGNGHWADFIETWLAYTENEFAPQVFRKWAGIALVAGALERRVWQVNSGKVLFPSLFTLLVAPPAVGKNIISEARDLLAEALEPNTKLRAFHLASDSVTSASLMDELGEAICLRHTAAGADESHSLFLASEEFSVLCPAYDMSFISRLNRLWDCPQWHSEKRRASNVKELRIAKPQLNLLGGIQPMVMAQLFPEEIWQTGIARRMIMVYSNEEVLKDLFATQAKPPELRAKLLYQLGHFSSLWGQMQWHPEAASHINQWYMGGQEPQPTHSKLNHYNRSRIMMMIKLSMIAAVSARAELTIRLQDVQRAMQWLFSVEALMPDIFREMVGRSDFQVIQELHVFVQQLWLQAKRPASGVPSSAVHHFLAQRLPSDRIDKLLDVADRSDVVKRTLLGGFLPRPKHTHGVE